MWASVFWVAGTANMTANRSEAATPSVTKPLRRRLLLIRPAKMFFSSRSNVRVQSSIPSAALINSATIRTFVSLLAHRPFQKRAHTQLLADLFLCSSFRSLKRKEELRPMTLSSLI